MPAFRPFDPRATLDQTRRNLPHWQQPGATYFITFRLADSLPAEVCARFAELRKLNDEQAFAWIERYLDAGAGSCLFAQVRHATTIDSALRHFDAQRYMLGAFAVMPNHIHALVQPVAPVTLTSVVHAWKSYTANKLQRATHIRGPVWQEESFDRIVRDETELRRYHDYIPANPTVARLAPGTFIVGQGSANWLPA